uniref:Retrotransposon gag domain-containing protein n=1 Tax=Cajanus cajan TaxID=3821 RepID=A0A151U5W2_CAJCA|nr:hypothetical protein KK1_007335 [Cajanus cajan]
MNNEITSNIIYIDEASIAWKELKDRFSQCDFVRISQLHVELYSLKQFDLFVINYFTQLRILWDELCIFRPMEHTLSY